MATVDRPISRRRGFSLTEILIVIALIVLILALALPAFNFITGGRSVDAAMNQISAFLVRARTEAVGVQDIRGVMFYVDPASKRPSMMLVKTVPGQGASSGDADVWLDQADGNDHLQLPKGISIETLNDATSPTGIQERYYGFNPVVSGSLTSGVAVGGVVLFDGYGRLTSKSYGFRLTSSSTSDTGPPSAFAQFMYPGIPLTSTITDATLGNPTLSPPTVPQSTFGFVVFDESTMMDVRGADYRPDPTLSGQSDPSEISKEEPWLDNNATPVLINRYNGTLVKGE